jgi:hypothetical protein
MGYATAVTYGFRNVELTVTVRDSSLLGAN